jgi:hypothetical protein
MCWGEINRKREGGNKIGRKERKKRQNEIKKEMEGRKEER